MANLKVTQGSTGFGAFLEAFESESTARQASAFLQRVVVIGAGGIADDLLRELASVDKTLEVKQLLTMVNSPTIPAVQAIEGLEGKQLIHLTRTDNQEFVELTPAGAKIAETLVAAEAGKKRHGAKVAR